MDQSGIPVLSFGEFWDSEESNVENLRMNKFSLKVCWLKKKNPSTFYLEVKIDGTNINKQEAVKNYDINH